jgi:hypothetical protein
MADMSQKLAILNKNYTSIKNKPFNYFYCPILHKDEQTELCEGHIINKKFPNASRTTVVQRSDVDSFYGSHFENDFLKLRFSDYSFEQIMLDDDIRKQVRPTFSINGNPIEISPIKPDENLPPNQSRSNFQFDKDKFFRTKPSLESFGISPHFGAEWEGKWGLQDEIFVTIPALIKAAHLTLFRLLGYNYALSYVGKFIGYDLLGKFFLQNVRKPHREIQENAKSFFKPYINMINPVKVSFRGTIEDELLFACASNGVLWGRIVIVYLGTKQLTQAAVMIPISATPQVQEIYHQFLEGKLSEFDTLLSKYNGSLLLPHTDAHRSKKKWIRFRRAED